MDRISTLVTRGGDGGAVRPTVESMVTSQAPLHVPACPGRLRTARALPVLRRAWLVMRRGRGAGADIQLFPAVLPQRGVQPAGLGQLLGQRDVSHEKRRPGRAGEVVHLDRAADNLAEGRDDLAAAEQGSRRGLAALVRHHPPLAVLQCPGRVQPVPPALGLHLVRAGLHDDPGPGQAQRPGRLREVAVEADRQAEHAEVLGPADRQPLPGREDLILAQRRVQVGLAVHRPQLPIPAEQQGGVVDVGAVALGHAPGRQPGPGGRRRGGQRRRPRPVHRFRAGGHVTGQGLWAVAGRPQLGQDDQVAAAPAELGHQPERGSQVPRRVAGTWQPLRDAHDRPVKQRSRSRGARGPAAPHVRRARPQRKQNSWHPPVPCWSRKTQIRQSHYPGCGPVRDMAADAEDRPDLLSAFANEVAGGACIPSAKKPSGHSPLPSDDRVPAHLRWRPAMTVEFGLALENFTPERKVPDMDAVVAYSATAEELGFASVWAWDHLFLGARRPFPFLEALTTLSWVAARTSRIMLGTGVLVLPIREPAIVAKTAATFQLASGGRLMLGVASGWYEREFDATAVPFRQRGQIFERNLDLMLRLWADDDVTGEWDGRVLKHVRMLPLPRPRPQLLIGGYVDKVLRRVATRSDGWVTYFYTPASITSAWSAIRRYAEEAGRDPAQLNVVAQVPLCIGSSYEEATRRAGEYVGEYFDVPAWSEATPESAVRGTPEQCAEQIAALVDAGARHLVFCPYNYETEQVRRLAAEVLPLLGPIRAGVA